MTYHPFISSELFEKLPASIAILSERVAGAREERGTQDKRTQVCAEGQQRRRSKPAVDRIRPDHCDERVGVELVVAIVVLDEVIERVGCRFERASIESRSRHACHDMNRID